MANLVILVPGFAASHLFRQAGIDTRVERLWLNQLEIAWNGISDLDTDPAVSPPLLDRVRPGGVLAEVYQPFLGYCQLFNLPVLQWGYDWRTDIATNGQRLANAIEQQREYPSDITIVAHSMGGLVAASAINRLSDAMLPRVKRLITCGCPWKGSYRAFELMTGYHDIVQTIINLNRTFSRNSREHWRLESVRVVASWAGVADMLPMPEMMNAYPPGPGQDFRADPLLGLANPWWNVARYTEALARRPINVGFPPTMQHHNWRGIGRRTAGPMPTVDEAGRPHWYLQALLGDGTVPEFSSQAPHVFESFNRDFDADHEQFLNDYHVLRAFGRVMGVAA